jgi:uncharacterized membrane protein
LSLGAGKFRTLVLVLAVVCLNAVGNLSLAWGMRHSVQAVALNPIDYIRALESPYVAAGTLLLILWLLTRMALLSRADLSFVVPLTSLGYILAAVLGRMFLSETVAPARWLGTLLIVGGTAIVGGTRPKTQARAGESA